MSHAQDFTGLHSHLLDLLILSSLATNFGRVLAVSFLAALFSAAVEVDYRVLSGKFGGAAFGSLLETLTRKK